MTRMMPHKRPSYVLIACLLINTTIFAQEVFARRQSSRPIFNETQINESIEREQQIKEQVIENENAAKKRKVAREKQHNQDMALNENCQLAKTRLEALLRTSRVQIKTSEGDVRYISPAERLKEIETVRDDIKRFCL